MRHRRRHYCLRHGHRQSRVRHAPPQPAQEPESYSQEIGWLYRDGLLSIVELLGRCPCLRTLPTAIHLSAALAVRNLLEAGPTFDVSLADLSARLIFVSSWRARS